MKSGNWRPAPDWSTCVPVPSGTGWAAYPARWKSSGTAIRAASPIPIFWLNSIGRSMANRWSCSSAAAGCARTRRRLWPARPAITNAITCSKASKATSMPTGSAASSVAGASPVFPGKAERAPLRRASGGGAASADPRA